MQIEHVGVAACGGSGGLRPLSFAERPLRAVDPFACVAWRGADLRGTSFAIWARVRLAGNWSGTVTLKQNHELIVEGPYRWVRHPIYSGLLTAIIGTALARGEWRGLIAVAVATIALWRKLRLEEIIMRSEFSDTYSRYAERVPALVPWLL